MRLGRSPMSSVNDQKQECYLPGVKYPDKPRKGKKEKDSGFKCNFGGRVLETKFSEFIKLLNSSEKEDSSTEI